MSEIIDSIEIAPDTYWVGKREPEAIFFANPFLRIFRSSEKQKQISLLIDPGSQSDFAVVSAKVTGLIGDLRRVSAVFINHQDPDVGTSATTLIHRFARKAAILCSEDTWRLIVHLNLPRENFVSIDGFAAHGMKLGTGHRLLPVPSPFCHFRGAVMLYDPQTRVLFSGDLFGGLTESNATGIWADESDWRGIRAFHQLYMPANKALVAAVERIRALDPAPELIAPQHGRLIRGPLIADFLERMEQLPVGLDLLGDEAKDLDAWNIVLERVLATAGMLLGPHAQIRLADERVLEDSLSFDGRAPAITSTGRWTLGKVIETLCRGEPPQVANPIKFEAIAATEELGLPAPPIKIEGEAEDNDTGFSVV
ncbi:MAG: hypothetical protein R6X02_23225 [Enhygromyxa sp.]